MNKAENHEVVSIYTLDDDVREAMLLEQKECVLNWCTQDEWPMGVIHSYIWRKGSIWITAAAHRHRVQPYAETPKSSVVITSKARHSTPANPSPLRVAPKFTTIRLKDGFTRACERAQINA